MTRNTVLAAAIGSLFALSLTPAMAAESASEKCYGVALAGKNDCATAAHACAGQATTNKDPAEWKKLPKGSCEKMGGSLSPAAK